MADQSFLLFFILNMCLCSQWCQGFSLKKVDTTNLSQTDLTVPAPLTMPLCFHLALALVTWVGSAKFLWPCFLHTVVVVSIAITCNRQKLWCILGLMLESLHMTEWWHIFRGALVDRPDPTNAWLSEIFLLLKSVILLETSEEPEGLWIFLQKVQGVGVYGTTRFSCCKWVCVPQVPWLCLIPIDHLFSLTSPIVAISQAVGMMPLTSDFCTFCNRASMLWAVFLFCSNIPELRVNLCQTAKFTIFWPLNVFFLFE